MMRAPSIVVAALAAALATAACDTSPNQPIDPLEEAFGAAFDVLTVYAAQGDIAQQGVDMVDALTVYAGDACAVLVDPALTPEERSFAIEFTLAPQRQAFDAALRDVADIGGINPAYQVLISRARSIARHYLDAGQLGPERWQRPCAIAAEFANGWAQRRPIVSG